MRNMSMTEKRWPRNSNGTAYTREPAYAGDCDTNTECWRTWGICNNNNNDPDWGICTRRAGKLYKARSRLYRIQILQVNMCWKALAEIYTMHSFAPFSNRKIFVKNC